MRVGFIEHGNEHIDHDNICSEHVCRHDKGRNLIPFWAADFVFQVYVSECMSAGCLRVFFIDDSSERTYLGMIVSVSSRLGDKNFPENMEERPVEDIGKLYKYPTSNIISLRLKKWIY